VIGEFFKQVLEVIEPLRVGFQTTGRHLLEKPVTYEYPEVRKPMADRGRWRHRRKCSASSWKRPI